MTSIVSKAKSRPLFMALSVLMVVIAVVGFWPTYFGPLVKSALVQPLIIHWHVLVFTGWLLLFFAQTAFAATGRVSAHIKLGRIGIVYGACLIAVGVTTGVIRAGALEAPEGASLLMAAIADMTVFAVFFGLAIAYRKKPHIHKRAMVVAATMLLVAAVTRMWFLTDLPFPWGLPTIFLIWFSPILIAAAHDWFHGQRVHPVYIAGIVVLVLRFFLAELLARTGAWKDFANGVFELWGV